ncbi:glycosyl hydrolase family 16 [Nonlabens sp.]|uniref:glycosyl hydrolase family 16 n=1 Tax=Nonlabens sp. TaxID=1888209 RepID=UPI001BCEE886|nr:glycosyl hydrolase family 16 [Nonlabens sp.]
MKNRKPTYFKDLSLIFLILGLIVSCERDLSEDSVVATFPNTGEVFTDNPINLTDEFFISFDPAQGANTEGFGIDNNVAYAGTSSIRIDVPAPNDPNGSYIGGIFKDRSGGRNLTGYDALTFWAKGSLTATVGLVGFGTDFVDDKYAVGLENIQLSTDWRKYTIPIPNASRLLQEKGMFIFSAGTQSTNGLGYTLWIDELKFETLGTIAQPLPVILDGEDLVQQSFTGSSIRISGLTQTFNIASGENVTVQAAPSYFDFVSSDTSVAAVNELGIVSVVGSGTAFITATISSVLASGSLEVTSTGALPAAPIPTLPSSNVTSIFCDEYTNATSSNFEPGFGGSTTQAAVVTANNDSVLIYSNNNFTGIIFDNTVDASALSFMHVDVYAQQAGVQVEFQIRDIGANGVINTNIFTGQPEGDDADYRFTTGNLTVNGWNSFDIPLTGGILNQKNNLGAIILAGGPNFILDNIYFYTP